MRRWFLHTLILLTLVLCEYCSSACYVWRWNDSVERKWICNNIFLSSLTFFSLRFSFFHSLRISFFYSLRISFPLQIQDYIQDIYILFDRGIIIISIFALTLLSPFPCSIINLSLYLRRENNFRVKWVIERMDDKLEEGNRMREDGRKNEILTRTWEEVEARKIFRYFFFETRPWRKGVHFIHSFFFLSPSPLSLTLSLSFSLTLHTLFVAHSVLTVCASKPIFQYIHEVQSIETSWEETIEFKLEWKVKRAMNRRERKLGKSERVNEWERERESEWETIWVCCTLTPKSQNTFPPLSTDWNFHRLFIAGKMSNFWKEQMIYWFFELIEKRFAKA